MVTALEKSGFSQTDAKQIADQGYFLHPMLSSPSQHPMLSVLDRFYGTKESTIMTFEAFVKYAKGEVTPEAPVRGTAVYQNVKNYSEVFEILNSKRHKSYFESGRMSFRGQNQEYFIQRTLPNPATALSNGKERVILPSIWRPIKDCSFTEALKYQPQSSVLNNFAAPLIYNGISDWQGLSKKNFERYGIHNMEDLKNFPDLESQEYYKRWRTHENNISNELTVLEQHYGIDTAGLDISYDPLVSLFFSTHKFIFLPSGKATFGAIAHEDHSDPVLYCFVLTSPSFKKTESMIKEMNLFQHSLPVRPIVQKCALPIYNSFEISGSVLDLDAVIYLDKTFSISELPKAPDLFPASDQFYQALIDQKKINTELWHKIVEYEF